MTTRKLNFLCRIHNHVSNKKINIHVVKKEGTVLILLNYMSVFSFKGKTIPVY